MSTGTTFSEPTPPAPEAPPKLSEVSRVVNVFVAPSKTFEDIRRNASWWVPWLLAAVLQIGFSFTFGQKIGWESVIEKQWEKSPTMSARLNSMKPEEKERAMEQGAKVAGYIGYAAPITVLIYYVIAGAICMAIFNFGFGAEIPFKQSLSAFAYAGLPLIVFSILAIITMNVTTTPDAFNLNNPLASNPAYFLDPAGSKLLYWLGSVFDVFGLWVVALLGLGFSILSNRKVKFGASFAVFFVLYAIFKGIGAIRM